MVWPQSLGQIEIMDNSILTEPRYNKTDHAIALLSGGLGSFLAAYLYKANNPEKQLIGYFTDVKQEDLDTYRFLRVRLRF
jgi:hypothetical protein